MSNAKMNLPDHAGAIKRFKDELTKKRAAVEGKKPKAAASKEGPAAVPEHVYVSSPEHQSRKKQKRDTTKNREKDVTTGSKEKPDDVFEPDSSMVLLSSGLSSFTDPVGFLAKSEEFLLPADELYLRKQKTSEAFDTTTLSIFQALQGHLQIRKRYKLVSEKCSTLRKSNDTLKAEKAKLTTSLQETEQKCSSLELSLKSKEEENSRLQEESTKYKADAVEKKGVIADLEDQLESIASVAMCKARVELFKEYMSGDHVNWDRKGMQEEIDLYEEMRRLEASTSGGVANTEGAAEKIRKGPEKGLSERPEDPPSDDVAAPPLE